MPLWLRRKYLATLCKICRHHVLIPQSIQILLCYNRTEDPRYEGGFARVWKGEHEGIAVAVKVLKVFKESDLVKIKRVGFPISQRARVDWLVPTTQRFCKEAMTWKALRHQNTLPLLGVMMSGNQFVMVSEWMANGNITEFIETHRDANRFKLVGLCSAVDYTCR
jgi:serine/threonine protein kinase